MLADARLSTLKDVHCVAAEAFTQTKKPHHLKRAADCDIQVFRGSEDALCSTPSPAEPWICYTAVAASTGYDNPAVATTRSALNIMPTVIEFEETAGRPMACHEIRAVGAGGVSAKTVALPLAEWLTLEVAKHLDRENSDMAAMYVAMRSVSVANSAVAEHIDIVLDMEIKR
jgi:hypothetical protein